MAKKQSKSEKKALEKDQLEKKPKLEKKFYEKELRKLQTELCILQEWVVEK